MSNIDLFDEIRNEFTIDVDGKAWASRSAVARLADRPEVAVRRMLEKVQIATSPHQLPKMLETFTGSSFECSPLPDVFVAALLNYFAYEAPTPTEKARLVCCAFATIGFRSWVQAELGWAKPNESKLELMLGQLIQKQEEQGKLLVSLKADVAKLHEIEHSSKSHPGFMNAINFTTVYRHKHSIVKTENAEYIEELSEVLTTEPVDFKGWMSVSKLCKDKGIVLTAIQKREASRRAAENYRFDKGENPVMRGSTPHYAPEDTVYPATAIRQMLGL